MYFNFTHLSNSRTIVTQQLFMCVACRSG